MSESPPTSPDERADIILTTDLRSTLYNFGSFLCFIITMKTLDNILRAHGLEYMSDSLCKKFTVYSAVRKLTESRPAFMADLKEMNAGSIPERQKLCKILHQVSRDTQVKEDEGEFCSKNVDVCKKIDSVCEGIGPVPHEASVVVVGAGIAGLQVAHDLTECGNKVLVLEKCRAAGGVWRYQANSYSRVNSSEPSYRLRGCESNLNHTPAHQIRISILSLLEKLDKSGYTLCTRCCVDRILHSDEMGAKWTVSGNRVDGEFVIACWLAVLCTNRRLGSPRDLCLSNENAFNGVIRRGLASDAECIHWMKKQVLIVGMGAFALEHFRTALERGASYTTILCRQRGTVCPQVIDWVNFIRPIKSNFSKDANGNMLIQSVWTKTYLQSGAKVPECWNARPRLLKPDGHTVSTSDIFFVAHYMRLADTILGEVECLKEHGVKTQNHGEHPSSEIDCDVIIMCVGFNVNNTNSHILGRDTFRGIGLVDEDLWHLAEFHLDAKTFSLPFGSSYLGFVQYVSSLICLGFRDKSHMLKWLTLPCNANVATFTGADVNDSIQSANEIDPCTGALLHQHVQDVRQKFNESLGFREYLDCNETTWKEHHMILSRVHSIQVQTYLPWLFRDLDKLVWEQ